MLRALLRGEQNAEQMAELALGVLRKKLPELQLALEGNCTQHHRFLLDRLLSHVNYLEEQVQRFSTQIALQLQPLLSAEDLQRLNAILGAGTFCTSLPEPRRIFGAVRRLDAAFVLRQLWFSRAWTTPKPLQPSRAVSDACRKIPEKMLANGRTRGIQCRQRNVGTLFSSSLQAGRVKPGASSRVECVSA